MATETSIDSANNSAITGLHADDFVLREDGHPQPIRSFRSEDLPVDVLFLRDVSASMKPHVQRIADASGQASTVLAKDDRMGIMVFDGSTACCCRFRAIEKTFIGLRPAAA